MSKSDKEIADIETVLRALDSQGALDSIRYEARNQALHEYDEWNRTVLIPYDRAARDLLRFPALITALVIIPQKQAAKQAMQGQSAYLASYIQEYINKSNALVESVSPDSQWSDKQSELIGLMSILAESVGRIETAPNDKALQQAIEDTHENLRPVTGTIYDDLLEIRYKLPKKGRPKGSTADKNILIWDYAKPHYGSKELADVGKLVIDEFEQLKEAHTSEQINQLYPVLEKALDHLTIIRPKGKDARPRSDSELANLISGLAKKARDGTL